MIDRLRECPECRRMVPPSHFYPKSGKSRCCGVLRWTLARRWRVMGLIENGRSNAQIADVMGVSEASIKLMRKRYGLPKTNDSILTGRRVAEMMGIGCPKTVGRWVFEGFLAGKKWYQQGPYRIWMVSMGDLLDFLADERYWHVWDPERITDPDLKGYADRVRGGVRFLTPRQAAWEFYVEHRAINRWIHTGKLPARRWGNWWIDERDVERLKQDLQAA